MLILRLLLSTGKRTALLGLFAAAAACEASNQPVAVGAAPGAIRAARTPSLPEPPSFETRLPLYPSPVLYIVGREYVLEHGLTSLDPGDRHYQQYVERRLRQLYPGRGHAGMVSEAVAEWKRFRARWSSYEAQAAEAMPDLGTICPTSVGGDCTGGGMEPVPSTSYDDDPSWSGVAEYPPPPSDFVPTVEEEIDTLQAEPAEVERVYYYESLASGSYRQSVNTMAAGTQPLSIDDLIRLAGEGWTPMDGVRAQGLGTTLVGLPLGIALPYYYQWRIETAGNRAEQRASQYFPGNQGNTRADAFRHTFLSMQLRRYLTAPFAKLVTDKYEEQYSVRYPEEMMDKHNNTLGREAKYQYFRGHWFWDRWDWKEWAVRVRNYVADPANGEFIPEWAVDPSPAPEQVDTREQAVPTWKYIYISNG